MSGRKKWVVKANSQAENDLHSHVMVKLHIHPLLQG